MELVNSKNKEIKMTYEFYCEKCDRVQEVDCSMSERDEDYKCKKCKSVMVRYYDQNTKHYWVNCEWPCGYSKNPKGD